MNRWDGIAVVLAAAGLSTRFGGNKLMAGLNGQALAIHAADTGAALVGASRFAIVRPDSPVCTLIEDRGYALVMNDRPEAGLARSIALGAAAAQRVNAHAMLLLLADMPFVPRSHCERLLDALPGHDAARSTAGDAAGPPVLFGAAMLPLLAAMHEGEGAGALLAGVRTVDVAMTVAAFRDVDRPGDLS